MKKKQQQQQQQQQQEQEQEREQEQEQQQQEQQQQQQEKPIKSREANIITTGAWLEDTHMDQFGQLVKKYTSFSMRETWKVQWPELIEPVKENVEHIQILFSGTSNIDGHWVCSYFDKKNLYIYDSLNKKKLHNDHKIFLSYLYPFLFLDEKIVKFPKVQQQSNNSDCGVFAIAFATSLLYGIKPDEVKYDQSKMRSHVLNMFQTFQITHFPQNVLYGSEVQVFPLSVVQSKRYKNEERRNKYQYQLKKKEKKSKENIESMNKEKYNDELKNIQKINIVESIGKKIKKTQRINIEESIKKERNNNELKNMKNINIEESIKKERIKKERNNNELKKMQKINFVECIQNEINNNNNDLRNIEKMNIAENIKKKIKRNELKKIQKINVANSIEKEINNNELQHIQKNNINESIENKINNETNKIQKKEIMESIEKEKNCSELQSKQKNNINEIIEIEESIENKINNNNGTIEIQKKEIMESIKKKIKKNELEKQKIIHNQISYNVQNINYERIKKGTSNNASIVIEKNINNNNEPNEIKKMNTVENTERGTNNNESKKKRKRPNKNIDIFTNGNKEKKLKNNELQNIQRYSNENIKEVQENNKSRNSNLSNTQLIYDNKLENYYHTNVDNVNNVIKNCELISTDQSNIAVFEMKNLKKRGIKHESSTNVLVELPCKRMKADTCYKKDKDRIRIKNKLYYEKNKETVRIKQHLYYDENKDTFRKKNHLHYVKNKASFCMKNRLYYEKNKDILLTKIKMRCAQKISSKYKKITIRGNNIVMRFSAENYVNKIAEKIEIEMGSYVTRNIEAQRIFKWCLYVRENYLYNIRKVLNTLKEKAELCLTKLDTLATNDIDSKRDVLCGTSKHTATSEAYFAETMYNDISFPEFLIMNDKGQVTNVLPLIKSINNKSIKKFVWYCSDFCKNTNESILERYVQLLRVLCECRFVSNVPRLLQRIGRCTVKHVNVKLGHSHVCYIKPEICDSLLLAVNFLSPHFPLVRSMGRLINSLINNKNKLDTLDKALEIGDLPTLYELIKTVEEEAKALKQDANEIDLNEDQILLKYARAFKALTKRCMDTPRHECVSCEKLVCWKDLRNIAKFRKPLSGKYWQDLEEYLKNEEIEVDYICQYCLKYLRKNSLPPTCILNNLYTGKVPKMFSNLNDYEKILIQRAKAFQSVQRMGTVTNKKVPHKQMIQKIKGRTFHLPLPIEETLKKICPAQSPINYSHELYILVCGIPTKSKMVWKNLVDVKKLFEILQWLKENNKLYSEIVLPGSSEELLNDKLNDIEFNINDMNENIEKCAALLTQITDTEGYYEQYTIYPMYEKRKNETATDLYQLLKVEAAPLDNREKQLDLLCFPDLYPYGINGVNEERPIRLREFDFVKSRLMSKHSQFRLNIQYLFFLLNNANMRQINSGIYHKLSVVNPRYRCTAADFLTSMNKKELEGNLNTIFGKLPNTKQYWSRVRNDVNAMTREYGPATWFLTFSPSEWLWSDLAEYIKEVSPTLSSVNSVSELVALDPVSAARFIQNKFIAMLDFICSPDNPIGIVKHYFMRREYQSRGMPHCHLMIWIEDAPIIGKSSNEEVMKFILKYITCKVPNKKVSPLLYRRVTTHQEHHHNDYCLRRKKTTTRSIRICRFGFPRPVTDKLVLRDVAVSIANRRQLKSKSRLYDLPRSDREKSINDYNPVILTAWEGNMDIQFIGEKSTLLNWYCTKYTTKTECSYGVDTFDIINSTKSLRSCLWNIALRSLNNRECGALEAADTLLGIALHCTDRDTTIRWLDVNQIRSRKIKTRKEIEALEAESTDIFCHSFIDNYYPNRPEELESSNLYDFAKWYDVSRLKPASGKFYTFYESDTRLYLKKRKRGYLINHYMYNANIQPEKYFYSLLLLFKPWRDVNELKAGCDTYAEAFASIKSDIVEGLQYHERIADIQKAFDHVKELIDENIKKNEEKGNESMNASENQLDCRPIEAEGAMQELRDAKNIIADLDLAQMISELNADQKRIFDTVTKTITDSTNPLRLYVSGEGGTGKSYLIKTLRVWVKQVMNKDTAVTAPTGIAAFNIDGLTVHRLFQLPVEHGHTPKYKSLSDAVLKTLRDELKDTVLFIIDEISMISNITFMYINLRLTEIFNTADSNDGWFGNKHILLFGDLLQLPPVHEEPAFIKMTKTKIEKCLGSLAPINLWTDLFKYDELTINMRQKGDNAYRELLSRIRLGIATESDARLLETRKIKIVSLDINDRLLELCAYIRNLSTDAICLLPTCYLCDVLNTTMLQQISGSEIKLVARDIIDCAPYFRKQVDKLLDKYDEDSSRTAGLNRCIIVKVGAKIMIRRNIDVTLGLVNGTIGEITEFSREPDSQDIESIKILSMGKIHTIERISSKFEIMDKAFVVRHQFPLSLSYGVTIHKSQGLTLKTAIVDAGTSVFSSGQIYVALSRISTLEGLHLINFDPNSIQASNLAILEYNRLRNLYRPDLSTINITTHRMRKKNDRIWAVSKNIIDHQIVEEMNNLNLPSNAKGFVNTDRVSCYANAVLQCVLYNQFIRNKLFKRDQNDELKILVDSYINKNIMILNSLGIRQLLGGTFLQNVQQDAAEFLLALLNNASDIKTMFEHQLSHTIRCTSCNETIVNNEPNLILSLPLSLMIRKKSMDLQEIINQTFSRWNKIEGLCIHCGGHEKLVKTDVLLTTQVVVIEIMLFSVTKEGISKITNYNIKAIPTTTVKLAGKHYKVVSAVFHHGETIHTGHYTSMIRDKKTAWISINDQEIQKKQWPRGAKSAYLFFLQSIE